MDSSLIPFLRPRGIAIVGASTSPEKLGYGVARNLTTSGFRGGIHFVSQSPGELFGRPVLTSLSQTSDPVDLAVLAVPAKAMPSAIQDCALLGIPAAIMISAGFREAGPQGAALEQQCLELARAGGIRLLGPNCIGIIDTHVPFDTSFLQPPMPPKGGIAFLSHSGAFCAAIVDWSRRQGFGFSKIVSLGNQADVSETDMLPAVVEDDATKVVALYMEGVSDGVRFVEGARLAAARKPVIAIKVGRTESGRTAATSHTAALVGSDTAFEAAFAKSGILRAQTAEQLFDWARALERCPLPDGPRICILTDAGGPGVIAADAVDAHGLQLARLGDNTRQALGSHLPPAASTTNPVDMLASASPDDYAFCLRTVLGDPGVDGVLVILPPPPMFETASVASALIPIIRTSSKPVLIALLGSELVQAAFNLFSDAGIPTYPFPERGISALAALHRRRVFLGNDPVMQTRRPFAISGRAAASPLDLLHEYGISTPASDLAASPQEAIAIAARIGYPIVMKIASTQIPHKSDVGGVIVNVGTDQGALTGYAQVIEAAHTARPDAILDGVVIQKQIDGGQDVIVGVARDAQFGPLIMFGSGGIEAEGLRDVAFALAPLSRAEADDLMDRTWAGRRLKGYRSIPAVDRAAAQDVLIRMSWLAHEHPEIGEIEINPLRVMSQGAVALDVRSGI